MKPMFFYPNENDKVEFTREELEKLLKDVYEEGRADGVKVYTTTPNVITVPYYPVYYNTTPKYGSTEIWCTSDNSIGNLTIERQSLTAGDINVTRNDL